MFATLLAQSSSSGDAAAAGAGLLISLISLVIGLAVFAFHIYVLIDILKHSDAAWQASGQNKTLWIVLWVVAFCCGGLIIDLIYWFVIRPKVLAAGSGGAGGYPNYPG